ncbi:MAG: hypothetical protein H7Y12_05300 [Sphingobacteriaceae bacterium]|nr:hypothetical protein [Cytophagaceae bacterium]
MELSDELLEEIGAYLSGRLTAAEKARFEARLQADSDLRDEVATQREIKQGLQFLIQKERFKAMHADLQQRGLLDDTDASETRPAETRPVKEVPLLKQPVVRPLWTYIAVAASLVLVLGLGWMIYQNRSDDRIRVAQNAQAFDAAFSAVPKPVPVAPSDPDRVAAPLPAAPSSPDSIRLLNAVGALQVQELPAAIDSLRVLAQGAPGHWSASAEWYLALAYLKADQRDQAQPLLARMAALNGHPYQREAQSLRRQLDSSSEKP